jgi:heme/copper-type cytochrome/quinol oxidase subunit 4
MTPFLRNLAILAAVALVIVLLNLEVALATVGTLLRIAFILAIAVVAYFFWRDFARREIGTWSTHAAVVFYCAVALLVADLGWLMLGSPQGRDALAAFVVAAVAVYVGVTTWRRQKSHYS